MKRYQRILVAVALHESDASLVERALAVAADGAELALLHVCEQPVSGWGGGAAGGVRNPEMAAREAAFPLLKALADRYGIGLAHRYLELGRPADHICEHALTFRADLVVAGSHARGGWRAVLGSTANAVLHGASCDVLTVRLQHS